MKRSNFTESHTPAPRTPLVHNLNCPENSDDVQPFYHGLPGSMYSVLTPIRPSQLRAPHGP